MIVFLVRHGLTAVTGQKLTGRLPGYPLSEAGRVQAAATGLRLADAPLKAIYSSPVERCVETAEAIAGHHRAGVTVVEEVSEIDYGNWQGRTIKSLYTTKGWKQLKARPGDFRFPGGETIREAQTRGMRAMETLRLKHKSGAIVVCSHADMIKLIVAGCLGMGIELYDRVNISPASITTIRLSEAAPVLLGSADTGDYGELFESLRSKAPERAGKASPRKGMTK